MSRGNLKHTAAPSTEVAAMQQFVQALSERAAHDPAFASTLFEAAQSSGLLAYIAATPPAADDARKATRKPASREATTKPQPAPPQATAGELLDPFAAFKASDAAGLERQLATLDVAVLKQIIRANRLDPARISARWTTRERLVRLIVDQVRARSNHGRAFERV